MSNDYAFLSIIEQTGERLDMLGVLSSSVGENWDVTVALLLSPSGADGEIRFGLKEQSSPLVFAKVIRAFGQATWAATIPDCMITLNVPAPTMLAAPVAIFEMSEGKMEQIRADEMSGPSTRATNAQYCFGLGRPASEVPASSAACLRRTQIRPRAPWSIDAEVPLAPPSDTTLVFPPVDH